VQLTNAVDFVNYCVPDAFLKLEMHQNSFSAKPRLFRGTKDVLSNPVVGWKEELQSYSMSLFFRVWNLALSIRTAYLLALMFAVVLMSNNSSLIEQMKMTV